MKKLILLTLLLIPFQYAFSEIRPTADSCVVIFGLTNNENIPYASRTIIFNNKTTGENKMAVTDTAGKAPFLLPKNTEFEIKVINGVVEVASYEMKTPEKQGLIKFTYNVQVDIYEENREGEIFKTNFYSNTDSLQPTDSLTLIVTTLLNKSKEPIGQASVLLRNDSTKEVYVGQTNDNGKFQLLLPIQQDFMVLLVDQGCRIPFINISTKLGRGKNTLALNLEYDYSEKQSYFEEIIKKEAVMPIEKEPDLFVLSDVLFDFDKSTLRPSSYSELNYIVGKLKHRKFKTINISGHTDSMGDDAYNLNLSDRRARSVMNYFTEMGLDPHKMHSIGMGERHPVATNDTADGRQMNRRTEIRLVN